MKQLGLVLVLAVTLARPARADEYLQADPKTFDLEGAKRIRIEFPVGKFSLEGDDGQTVRVQVRVDCKGSDTPDCQDEARRIRIDHRQDGGVFRLEFSGMRKNWSGHRISVEANVLVPRALAAELNMGVGKANVVGIGHDLDVELGVGDLNVRAEQAGFRDVEAESGVGDAAIETREGRVHEQGFIGHSARWTEGSGSGFIRAHVGVGSATVDLR
jgi:hypothetical protein